VPFAAIESLWEAFNDVADGFGITLYEFQEICAELTNELGVNRVKMDDKSDALFKVLDNDAVSLKRCLSEHLCQWYLASFAFQRPKYVSSLMCAQCFI
jgi:hypothetical protein